MPSTVNAPINSSSTALAGGTILSTLTYEPLDDWMGFQRQAWNPLNSAIGSTGPHKTPTVRRGWGNSSDTPYLDLLTQDLASSAGATQMFVAHPEYYTIGSIVVVDSERMLVVARGSNYVTVQRAFSGSTVAAHTTNDVAVIGATAMAANSDSPDAPFTQGDRNYNTHQMVVMAWTFDHRSQATVTHEFQSGNMMTTTLQNKMNRDLPQRLEIALLTGLRSVGTGVEASTVGGLDQDEFCTTRTPLSGDPLEERHLNDALQTASQMVGDLGSVEIHGPDIVGRILASYYRGAIRMSATDSTVSSKPPTFQTPYGDVSFVRNPIMNTIPMCQDKLYILKTSDIKRAPFTSDSNWQTGAHETQGWYDRQYIRGDITFLFPNEDSRIELSGFSTTTSHYPSYV